MAYESIITPFLFLMIVIGLWDGVWKAIALWKSARNSQLAWFIALIIFNTAGVLPIIYILFFQNKRQILVAKKSRKRRS
jgi:hypothetical protein